MIQWAIRVKNRVDSENRTLYHRGRHGHQSHIPRLWAYKAHASMVMKNRNWNDSLELVEFEINERIPSDRLLRISTANERSQQTETKV